MSVINKSMIRIGIGFLLAPLGPGLLFAFLGLLSRPGEGIWALGVFAIMYYPAMLLLGLPAHLLLVKLHWGKWWGYLLAGVVGGVIVAIALFHEVFLHNVSLLCISAVLGALTAWTFWLIARPAFPDPAKES